jgi:hypothetical protein
MNERIRELAEESYNEFYNVHIDLELFAELIVQECIGICFSEAKGHGMAFGEHCGIVIKEHFGVK